MMDTTELKKLAEALDGAEWVLVDGDNSIDADNRFVTSQQRIDDNKVAFAEINYGHPDSGMAEPFQSQQVAAGEFIAAANPAAVLALIAEKDRFFKLIERMVDGCLPVEEMKELPGYSRVLSAETLKAERDQLKAENDDLIAALNEILRVTPMGVEAFGIAALVMGELGVSKEADQ